MLIASILTLSGCLWQSFHLKGEVDAQGNEEVTTQEKPELEI
jgi:hypothetical protein